MDYGYVERDNTLALIATEILAVLEEGIRTPLVFVLQQTAVKLHIGARCMTNKAGTGLYIPLPKPGSLNLF